MCVHAYGVCSCVSSCVRVCVYMIIAIQPNSVEDKRLYFSRSYGYAYATAPPRFLMLRCSQT